MFQQRKREIESQALQKILIDCQDRCLKTDLEIICREISRNISNGHYSRNTLQQMQTTLQKAQEDLIKRNYYTARVHLNRTLEISMSSGEEKKMGILERIKKAKPDRENKSRDEILDSEEKAAEQRIYALEEKAAALFDTHSRLTKQLEDKAKQCSSLEKDDNMYRQKRQQAMALIPRIKSVEQQINMYARMLEESSRYQAMLEMGKATFELKKFMPEINKAEALMAMISEEVQDVSEGLDGLSAGIDEYDGEIGKASSAEAFASDEFDKRVSEIKAETEKKKVSEETGRSDPAGNGAAVQSKEDEKQIRQEETLA